MMTAACLAKGAARANFAHAIVRVVDVLLGAATPGAVTGMNTLDTAARGGTTLPTQLTVGDAPEAKTTFVGLKM